MTPESKETQSISLFNQVQGRMGPISRRGQTDNIFSSVRRALIRKGSFRPSDAQIQRVLESVPDVFTEDWGSPIRRNWRTSSNLLTPEQRKVFAELKTLGKAHMTGLQVERIIEHAVLFRDYSQPASKEASKSSA